MTQPRRRHHLARRAQLSPAAVDQHQVGKDAEAVLAGSGRSPPAPPARTPAGDTVARFRHPQLVPAAIETAVAPRRVVDGDVATGLRDIIDALLGSGAQVAGEPPAQRLLHRGNVVRPLDRPDAEVPVVRRSRPSVLEDNHRTHRVRSHGVADVVALDAARHLGEIQSRLQVGEQRLGAVGVEVGLDARLSEGGARRLARLLHQLAHRPALRHPKVDRPAALDGEEVGQDLGLVELVGDQHHARHLSGTAVVLGDEASQAGSGGEVGDALELVGLHARHLGFAHRQHRHHAAPPLQGDGQAVLLLAAAVDHLLPLGDAVDGPEPVAMARRRFVVEMGGSLLHLAAQLSGQHRRPALHEHLHLVEQPPVVLGTDQPLTGAAAALDVVVEADPAAAEDLVAAGAEWEDGSQRLDGGAQRLGAGVGAEVASTVAGHPA